MLRRIIVILLVVPCVAIFGIWLGLAQPDFRKSRPSQSIVSEAVLQYHVRTLSVDFVPRNGAHLGNTKKTADYIFNEFAKIKGGQVSNQWFEISGSRRYRNVSLLIGNPTADRIVIGAHYDAFDVYPGADDNASGVAGVIELANLFAKNPIQTPIEFVGYPLEEPPYFASDKMGSWQHAKMMGQASKAKCKYMVSVEMIGYFNDNRGSQKYPLPILKCIYGSKADFITVVGNLSNRKLIRNFKVGMKGSTELPVVSISGPAKIPGIDFSDHRNYWRAGFPAVMITDTSFYRNIDYHTPRDTYDRLDYKRMAMVVKGIESAIRRLEK